MPDPNTSKEPTKTDPNAPVAIPPTTPPATGDGQKQVPLAALHESREREKALKEEVDALKSSMSGTFQNQPTTGWSAPPPVAPPQNNVRAQMDELWETNPRVAMQTEINMALNWYDGVNTQLDVQEADFASKHPDFDKYRPDVRKYLRSLPMNQRNNPSVVQAAYYYVKGQNVDNLISLSKEDLIAKIRSGESVQGLEGTTSAPPAPPTGTKQPTSDQVKVAQAMGMKIDDYMAQVR